MNTVVTSKEDILRHSRELIRRQGWAAVNIRSVAAACGVSVGSIYNYFDSKTELTAATVESIWQEIFPFPPEGAFAGTLACIEWIYQRIGYGCRRYPGIYALHSFAFGPEKAEGRQRMQRAWTQMEERLGAVLRQDPRVRPHAFDGAFTAEAFAAALFALILAALLREDDDPTAVLEIVRRTVY